MREKIMRKKLSKSEKIRRLLVKGYAPKEIAQMMSCDVQHVYNIRWYDKKRTQGLGSLPVAAPPVPEVGIVVPKTPRPRGRPRKEVDASDKREAVPRVSLWQRVKGIFAPWR